ncbi:MAG: hypothetical protein ABSE43_07665 [Steroidobacteraceae bacterium]|jgi:hypothetical protein
MKIKPPLLLLLVIVASPGMAGVLTLRATDIGDSCQDAYSRETILGAQPAAQAQQMFETGTMLFTDSSVTGQVTQTLYQCRGGYPGAVFGYSITIQTADEAHARTLYDAAKAEVVNQLKSPQLDSDKLKAADKKAFDDVSGGPRALSSWDAANSYTVHVSLQKSSTSDQWTVVTSVHQQQSAATPKAG